MTQSCEFYEHKLIIKAVDDGPECPAAVFIEWDGKVLMDYLDRFQWLNGEHVVVEIDPTSIDQGPLKTNRPVEGDEYMHAEELHESSNGEYYAITHDGYLQLYVDGRERTVMMLFKCIGQTSTSNVVLSDELVAA